MRSFVAMLGLRRGISAAIGIRRDAQRIFAEVWIALLFFAGVFGVAMVSVKVLVEAPGGRIGGLKDAVARLGRPVAASVIGLDIFP